jgi:hypothetical protein
MACSPQRLDLSLMKVAFFWVWFLMNLLRAQSDLCILFCFSVKFLSAAEKVAVALLGE